MKGCYQFKLKRRSQALHTFVYVFVVIAFPAHCQYVLYVRSIALQTCSTVPSTIYLVTSTDFICLNRIALAIAWFSTLGFHCGSTMKTRFADVKFNLDSVRYCREKIHFLYANPKAPVPVVMMRTGIFGEFEKSSRIVWRR